MDVFVNETRLSIFEGARVIDAIVKFYSQQNLTLNKEKITVCDEQDHLLSLNGEMNPGDKLKIVTL
jgi:hypothetical protein